MVISVGDGEVRSGEMYIMGLVVNIGGSISDESDNFESFLYAYQSEAL